MEYNTTLSPLMMREYGRHLQKMVSYLLTIENREKRNEQAKVIVASIMMLTPQFKNIEEAWQKIWDSLFVISNFTLDIDSPYPIPDKNALEVKDDLIPYPSNHPAYAHLGKNIETLIQKAINEENEEKKKKLTEVIAYCMKLAYNNWQNDIVYDEAIHAELLNISHGSLQSTHTLHSMTNLVNPGKKPKQTNNSNYHFGNNNNHRNNNFKYNKNFRKR